MKTKVGIIGASGYAGEELVRILLNHPHVEITSVGARSYIGQKISELFPSLYNIIDDVLVSDEEVLNKSDVVFASLPHGLSEKYAKYCVEKNKIFIDLGADFRLDNEEDYKEWYNLEYNEKELHKLQVYGLCEFNRDKIKNAKILGNPGCYVTSVTLGLYPLIKNNLVDLSTIIVDAKSGVTGSGRALSQVSHFPDCNESFAPYKIATHRHTPEIEQTLSYMSNEKVTITFVPHLLPLNRGIISTMYLQRKNDMKLEDIHKLYVEHYSKEKFVRVLPLSECANLKNVRMSNYCDISIHDDSRTNRIIIVSTLDNMIKGAAGQAVQNFNIIMGYEEDCALNMVPPAF